MLDSVTPWLPSISSIDELLPALQRSSEGRAPYDQHSVENQEESIERSLYNQLDAVPAGGGCLYSMSIEMQYGRPYILPVA